MFGFYIFGCSVQTRTHKYLRICEVRYGRWQGGGFASGDLGFESCQFLFHAVACFMAICCCGHAGNLCCLHVCFSRQTRLIMNRSWSRTLIVALLQWLDYKTLQLLLLLLLRINILTHASFIFCILEIQGSFLGSLPLGKAQFFPLPEKFNFTLPKVVLHSP